MAELHGSISSVLEYIIMHIIIVLIYVFNNCNVNNEVNKIKLFYFIWKFETLWNVYFRIQPVSANFHWNYSDKMLNYKFININWGGKKILLMATSLSRLHELVRVIDTVYWISAPQILLTWGRSRRVKSWRVRRPQNKFRELAELHPDAKFATNKEPLKWI